MKISNTFSIDLERLVEFNKVLKDAGQRKSTVLNELIQQWIDENKKNQNGQVVEK